jgi:hypothetical protein
MPAAATFGLRQGCRSPQRHGLEILNFLKSKPMVAICCVERLPFMWLSQRPDFRDNNVAIFGPFHTSKGRQVIRIIYRVPVWSFTPCLIEQVSFRNP